jgi:mannose-1-phosphate guanylyltransferase/phosphomannomutase
MIETELLRTLDAFRTGASLDVAEPFYDFGKHVFPAMLGQLPYVTLPADLLLWGIQYDGRWFDVGRKRDYLRVNEHVLDGELHVDLPYEKLPWGYLGNGVVIDFSRVRIVPPVVIGNNCIIEPGVTLGPYAVVGDGWVVESGAVIRHSVFWERYPYFSDAGDEVSARDRMVIDRHEVRRGVTVEECIVVGGAIERDVREKTVDVLEDGRLGIVPIDFVPTGTRA